MKEIKIGKFVILKEQNSDYLQINDIVNIDELWALINKDYSRYQIDFCYHNIIPPFQKLHDIGAFLLDDCVEMRYKITGKENCSSINITRITKDNFAQFAKYHDLKNGDMYWNSQRIFDHFDNWSIFVSTMNQEIIGYILLSLWNKEVAEIYALEIPNIEIGIQLTKSAIQEAKQTNHRQILAMVDRNSLAQSCCRELGFIETGFYQSFRKEPS